MKKVIILGFILLGAFIGFISTQIIPLPNESNTYVEEHVVTAVFSPCCQDVVFEMDQDDHINYINRGIEQNIDPEDWNNIYINKKLKFTFIKQTSLLRIAPNHRTIARIEFKNKIIYNAFT